MMYMQLTPKEDELIVFDKDGRLPDDIVGQPPLQFAAISVLLGPPTPAEQTAVHSPVNEAILYKYHSFFNGFRCNVSPFQVPPSKELYERREDVYNRSSYSLDRFALPQQYS
ncbi:hypothetical protein PC9H_004403 [Pleurotus ostreatus]|uniref:Uncharacterized protein n=1 Tax=Pleurotus ostreatus TaxID=5322 RepID=A0A8H7A440_PLEOS|nr:uncharacterized protein PC9H_004403 [Pleurotus ostreatus]KAF7437561.1 hypothetical protein PC9H_004403 [Pleurotus ostreatus]